MSSSSTTGNARSLPDDPVFVAETLISEGRAEAATALLEACLRANRGGLLLRLTLQKAYAATGNPEASLASAREAAQLNPDAAVAAVALGDALCATGHLPAAISEYLRALRLDPGLEAARIGLGTAWLEAGEAEKALESWHGLPDANIPPLAQKIADAEAALKQPRSDARYVRHLFDQFAADYDSRMLAHLNYRAPVILRELAELLGLAAGAPYAVLDLGCGTGLMGSAVRDWASRLDGVDLSPAMVQKSHDRGIYDNLFVSDIVAWLGEDAQQYDLMLAADTLVYLGELRSLFRNIPRALSPRGYFLFTIEHKSGEGFELGPKRRWRHSEAYLRAEAAAAGMDVAGLVTCAVRTEAGVPVEGIAAALRV